MQTAALISTNKEVFQMKKIKKIICLILTCSLLCSGTQNTTASKKHYLAKSVDWGLGLNKNHATPGGTLPYNGFSLKKYNTIYTGNTKKKYIYLTFDCGYENGHTKKILNILKEKNIKAIFFVTKPYIEGNAKLVKRMKKEGHLVGNHTSTHPRLGECNTDKIRSELKSVEKCMKKKTGYKLDKFVRPPEGNYSELALKTMQDMGYTTVLWSLAWYDYNPADQPTTDYVVGRFKSYYHKGMIPLLHAISKADTNALPKIIKYMKSKKYEFKTLDTIKIKNKVS